MKLSQINSLKHLTLVTFSIVVLMCMAVPSQAQLSKNANDPSSPIEAKILSIQELILAKTETIREMEFKIQDAYGTEKETWKKFSKMRSNLSAAKEELALVEQELVRWENILEKTVNKMDAQKIEAEKSKQQVIIALEYVPSHDDLDDRSEMGIAAK